ncbi:MAG: chemotaxis protein CheW [Nitrospirae bacterium]|nr:chemotaxis protein CheW [Nitrospirota bacterium]
MAPTQSTDQILIFRLAGERYAISIRHLMEIRTPTDLGNDPLPYVEGTLLVRGRETPVLDVRRVLEHPTRTSREEIAVLVLQHLSGSIGLTVDSVQEILNAASTEVLPLPDGIFSGEERMFAGAIRHDGEIILLLNEQAFSSKQRTP